MKKTATGNELRQIADLALFARIVQSGGITRCASSLGLERTTVSRRLRKLETQLGVRLLNRTPRHMSVTDAGMRCLEQCELLLDAARSAHSAATNGRMLAKPVPLVVGAPPHIFDAFLDRRLTEFEKDHPNVLIERYPVSEIHDDLLETLDFAIDWGSRAGSENSVTRLSGVRQSIYASPEYVENHGEPTSPFDLDDHTCIVEGRAQPNRVWSFRRADESFRQSVKGRFSVSGLLDVREATLAGLGLSQLPNYLCQQYVDAGRLVEVLGDYRTAERDLYLTVPRREVTKPRATTLRIYLEDAFRRIGF